MSVMNYDLGVVAWATNRDYIEKRMAVLETAAIHQRRGYKIKLLALAGYELFKETGVETLGYEVVDCASYFKIISEKYVNLRSVFKRDNRGDFFYNNTLRWMVIREFLTGNRVNVDGDLIVNRGAMEHLTSKKCDFFYPDSTCFLVANETFFESYFDIVNFIEKSPDEAFSYIRDFARKHSIGHWGLNSLTSVEDLDEERIAAFAIHRAKLYSFERGSAPELACPPFIAHAYGAPPFGRYLAAYSKRFTEGVFYEYRNDAHYFSGFPLCFMHYQEQLHFLLGCHQILGKLGAVDDMYRRLLPKSQMIDYVHSSQHGDNDAIIRFLWDVATNKYRYKEDFWDMRKIVENCENGGLSDIFTSRRWHYENIFIS